MKLLLRGAQPYWSHEGFIAVVRQWKVWSEQRAKQSVASLGYVEFHRLDPSQARDILGAIEQAGFTVMLEQSGRNLTASVALPYEGEVRYLRSSLDHLAARLQTLERQQGVIPPAKPLSASPVYQRLAQAPAAEARAGAPAPAQARALPRVRTTESNIGRYWLSRLGIFTLVLGIALFVSYTFRSIGPWGKIFVGLGIGGVLVGIGNYLVRRPKHRKWAMAVLGGGWALLYFTVYAAYSIPATKVIANPVMGLACLLAVIIGSISQSLTHRSAVLIFFSYFLAYVSITMVGVSEFTLLASLLLAVSIVVVIRRIGWNWLALLGLAGVHFTHYAWIEPHLYSAHAAFSGQETLWEALTLPWFGDAWRLYPLIERGQSLIHQTLLALYWALFATIGFVKTAATRRQLSVNLALVLLNGLLFATGFLHHLHIYVPEMKWMFSLGAAGLFFGCSIAELRVRQRLLSDAYLALAVVMLGMAVPMFFDGAWVTYGWAGGSAILAWLGVRYDRRVLRMFSWALGTGVIMRLLWLEHLHDRVLFTLGAPIQDPLFVYCGAGCAFMIVHAVYRGLSAQQATERRVVENATVIAAAASIGSGVLIGGLRTSASVVWLLESFWLMRYGLVHRRASVRVASLCGFWMAVVRMLSVDCRLDLTQFFAGGTATLRLVAVALSIVSLLAFAEWFRRQRPVHDLERMVFPGYVVCAAALMLAYLHDDGISGWVTILWGIAAFGMMVLGFTVRERMYRWTGLGMFVVVVMRLFVHDVAQLDTLYRIYSFILLGLVFIASSVLYNYYSKRLQPPSE